MLVHIVADHQSKISELRSLIGSQHRMTSALLNSDVTSTECDAAIAAADLRIADNIAALKEVSAKLRGARRRVFVIERKARLWAAQAYALGATHVLFSPLDQISLLKALVEPTNPAEPPADSVHFVNEAAAAGAASIALMFSAVLGGREIDIAGAKHAAAKIADAVAEGGLSRWLDTVRRHHEGTYQHCLLVTGTAAAFGLHLGLAKADMERLYSAAMFHDIGKATIPLAVLDKPGRLDQGERALIETHPAAGYEALKGTSGISTEILDAVLHHHEYLDGSGYPDRLGAADISDIVRILTISDIFAALIEHRHYKPTMARDQAYEIIRSMNGKLERPLVAAFKDVALNR